MDNNFEHLFSPIKIGNFTSPNRLAHVATDSGGSFADGCNGFWWFFCGRGD